MIALDALADAMYDAMRTAAVQLPPDVERALRAALEEETNPLARQHLEVSLENSRLATLGQGLVCGDTGYPLYFITAGPETRIEGGFSGLQKAAEQATARCTADAYLRPTMVDPLTRDNPGNNVGPGMPKVDLSFAAEGDGLDIIACPKGGGSEIFGTFYRMLFPSDGEAGICSFVIDSIIAGCYAGKICPPAIVGVGIGGTADLCMQIAKKAALLRPLGRRNPRPDVAALEAGLMDTMRESGIGPMGSAGINAVMAVNIDVAVAHTAALPVAVNAQCLVGRRWRAIVDAEGAYTLTGEMSEADGSDQSG